MHPFSVFVLVIPKVFSLMSKNPFIIRKMRFFMSCQKNFYEGSSAGEESFWGSILFSSSPPLSLVRGHRGPTTTTTALLHTE